MLLRQIQIRSLTASTPKKRNAACRAAPVLATFLAAAYFSAGRGWRHDWAAITKVLLYAVGRRAGALAATFPPAIAIVRVQRALLTSGTIVAAATPRRSGQATKRWCWPPARQAGCISWTEENVGRSSRPFRLPGFTLEADPMIMTDARRQAGRSFLLTSPLKREDADGD